MVARSALVGLATWLVGCASAPSAPPVETGPGLRFGWKAPARVKVHEARDVAGLRVELSYEAALEPDPEGYRLRHLDGRVEREGAVALFDLDAGAQSLWLGRTAHRLADLTDIIIDRGGRALRCVESPAILERVATLAQAHPKGARLALEVQAREAHAASIARQRCLDRWSSWVGAWVGFEATPGAPDVWSAGGDATLGEVAPVQVTDTHEGDSPLGRGLVRLVREQDVDGEALGEEAGWLVADLAEALGGPVDAARVRLTQALHEGRVDLDEASLTPAEASWTTTLRFALDGLAQERVTRWEWRLRVE